MTISYNSDESYTVTTVTVTDNTAINTMPTSTYDLVNVNSSTYHDYLVDSTSSIEIPQPFMVLHLPIESCKYDADSRTLFAFTPPPNTLGYPQTAKENWPDELRFTREELLRAAHHMPQSKVVLVAPRVIPVPAQHQMLDETYSLYRDDANDAWVRLYQSEKLRDYYFAMYRATKKNPYP